MHFRLTSAQTPGEIFFEKKVIDSFFSLNSDLILRRGKKERNVKFNANIQIAYANNNNSTAQNPEPTWTFELNPTRIIRVLMASHTV